jgi:hypothetical protein
LGRGVNQWPALTGAESSGQPRAIYIAAKNSRALLHGDWKLIARGDGRPELFHLAVVPYEENNLAATGSQRMTQLRTML